MFGSIKKKAEEAEVRDLGKIKAIPSNNLYFNTVVVHPFCKERLRVGKKLDTDELVAWCPKCRIQVPEYSPLLGSLHNLPSETQDKEA